MSTTVQDGQIKAQPMTARPAGKEEKTVSKVQRFVTLALFWGAFLSFLAVSIPHVAWLYQTYEPKDGNWYTLVTTYGVAVGIDVMIAWLSWVQVAGKGVKSGITWVFIVALSFLSWYANYLYGMNNDPVHQADIWNISLAWGITTTGYITPVIISAVPLFSLAYTAMLHTVMNQKVETIEEMRTRLQDLRERKEVEQKLKEVQGGGLKNIAVGAVRAGKETVAEIKKAAKEETVQPKIETDVQQSIPAGIQENDTEEETEDQDSFSISETTEKIFPVIEDEEFDTGDETFEETEEKLEEELSGSDRDTDPFQNAIPRNETQDETNGTANITFIHSSTQPKRETSARNKSGRKTAAQKAATIIKNNPDITSAELVRRFKITPQYARKLLSQQAIANETM